MSSSAGRVLILPKGEYNSAETYYMLDAVRYNGSLYLAKKTTVGNVPQEGDYWMLCINSGVWGEIAGTLSDQIDLKNALDAKQNTLTFDATPTDDSSNPVTSDGIYTALATKQNTLTFDATPTDESSNPVTSNGIYAALAGKQDTLTFDSAPTSASTNPVTSGGLYTEFEHVTAETVFTIASSGWSNSQTLIDGEDYYTYTISLTAVYTDTPIISIGATGTLPTAAEQAAYDSFEYATVDDSLLRLTLYATSKPTDNFKIIVKGVE